MREDVTSIIRNARYYILIKDDCTFYWFVAFLKIKSDAIGFSLKCYDLLKELEEIEY